MKKRGFRDWVFQRIEKQRKLTLAAAIGMAVVGLILFLLEGGLLFLLFWAAYSKTTAALIIVGMFGAMGIYSWIQAERELHDNTYKAVSHTTTVELHVVPPISQIWTWALGSLEADRSIIEKLIAITMQAPRLFCAAIHTWRRLDDVQQIDEETTLDVMKVLFRSDHGVRIQEIADGIATDDIVEAIRDVSLLDGIVFLTKAEVTLSIAPRLNDSLDRWRASSEEEEEKSEDLE